MVASAAGHHQQQYDSSVGGIGGYHTGSGVGSTGTGAEGILTGGVGSAGGVGGGSLWDQDWMNLWQNSGLEQDWLFGGGIDENANVGAAGMI
jgi:hypothetical protein